jgi:ankyrin repeat protein
MKLKTALISIPLIAFSILLTQSSIAYSCEEEYSTPGQRLKRISDDQSGVVFEVASNYQVVVNTTTNGGVWKKKSIKVTQNSNAAVKQNETQNLILLEAVENQDIEGAKAALAKGADANAGNPAAISALMLAASNGNLDIFNALLDAGADVNLESGEGETALMYAAAGGHLEMTKTLLEKGPYINVQHGGDVGATALINAAAGGHIEIVRLLLANGADVTIQTLYGDTALTLAQENGYLEIVELLEKAGS